MKKRISCCVWIGIAALLFTIGGAERANAQKQSASKSDSRAKAQSSSRSSFTKPASWFVEGASDAATPMIFPVLGGSRWTDTFGAPRDNGKRKHHGQDLPAEKMRPLVAVFDGVVYFRRTNEPNAHNTLQLRGDNGWTAVYMHINNDTPGTDDGLGSWEYAFPAWLQPGDRVIAGQLIGWVGDSGKAEDTGSHLHFELYAPDSMVNPANSLRAAQVIHESRLQLAHTDLKPQLGEIFVEGVARSVNSSTRIIVLDTQAESDPKTGKILALQKPKRRWIDLKETDLILRDERVSAMTLAEVLPGMRLSLVGKQPQPDKAIQARSAFLSLERPLVASKEPERPATPPAPDAAPPDARTAQLLTRINQYRRDYGASELRFSRELSTVSLELCKRGATVSAAELWDALKSRGYPIAAISRLQASGDTLSDPEAVIERWIAPSAPSRLSLMEPSLREIGLAYVAFPYGSEDTMHYRWIVILGARSEEPR